MIPRETDFTKEGSSSDNNPKTSKASSSKPTTTTSSWSRLKDPRIVRVSRAFGGKDRHSKVCTVRGLRDRRVRLSVPTAIQLYDLQDRLGLNQPSKVVDWLLNAAKHEIDELPPLQIPPGSFSPTLLPIITSHDHKHGLKIGGSINWPSGPLEQHNRSSEGRSKDVSEGTNDHRDQNWGLRSDDQEKQYNLENQDNSYVSSNHSSSVLPLLMNASSSSVPYNSFVRWDPSNLTLSHPPRSHGLSPHQPEDWPNFSLIPLQPTVSTPSGSHQVLAYQPGMTTQPYFHSQIGGSDIGDHQLHAKEVNFQSAQLSTTSPLSSPVGSSSQPVRQIHFNMMTANLLPSQSNDRLS